MMNTEKKGKLENLKAFIDQYSGTPSNLNTFIYDASPFGMFLRCAAEEIIIKDPLFLSELYKRCGHIEIAALVDNRVGLDCEMLQPSFDESNVCIDKETIPAEVVFDEIIDVINKRDDLLWEIDSKQYDNYKTWLSSVDEFIEDTGEYRLSFEVDEKSRKICLIVETDCYEIDNINSPLIKVMDGVDALSIKRSEHGLIRFSFETNGIWR